MPTKKRKWPHLLTVLLGGEEIPQQIVAQVRVEFRLLNPDRPTRLEQNRRRPRDPILNRVDDICTQMEWKGELEWVHYVFHPQSLQAEALPDDETLDELTPLQRALAIMFCEMLPRAWEEVAGNAVIRYRIIQWLTDLALEGDYAQVKPLPMLFSRAVFPLPFCEDKLLVALVTRFSDVDEVVSELKRQRAELFVPRTRQRDPDNIDRDAWVLEQYRDISETADHCVRSDIYEQLLHRFAASRWAHQLKRYDLRTYDGKKKAKRWLATLVSRTKATCAALDSAARQDLPPHIK